MRSFQIAYPVVDSLRCELSGDPDSALFIAETYAGPILSAAFEAHHRQPGTSALPGLLLAWQLGTGPYDIDGGACGFDPADGLVALLSSLDAGDLPVLDPGLLFTHDGSPAAPMDEVLRAIIELFSRAIAARAHVLVEVVA